ncbi:MAG: hypothetical protein ACE14L_05225 [Terriglobales bacterium]
MPINVFEGARRIALLLQVLWVIVCIIVVWVESPYVSLTYETEEPSAPFVKAKDSCGVHDAREYRSEKLEGDKSVNVTLCFKAVEDPRDRSMKVIYRLENGRGWINAPYSSEVMKYTQARGAQFTLPEEDRNAAFEEWHRQRRKQILIALAVAAGGWLVIALVKAVVGWIVRGFLGIPRGRDSRPESLKPGTTSRTAGGT